MLSVVDEKHCRQSASVDLYYPLDNTDVCLKIHQVERLMPSKIEIEIRNRHKEQPSAVIQHWSVYEIKYPRSDLPDRLLTRLDQVTSEKIMRYLQIIVDEEKPLERIQIEKNTTTWQMDDSDREIEESDIRLIMTDDAMRGREQLCYIPQSWRTISIRTGDYEKLRKTLTTLQIEDDRDLLDYFSFLISQTRLNSLSLQSVPHVLPNVPPEKAYVNLLTMSYAAFVELIERIYHHQQLQI